ncbi:MAG TPA: nuclear transport factor 2 family protein [Thermoanaerobaculia bacterium]|jgi:ketosteroid isomerase-like protein
MRTILALLLLLLAAVPVVADPPSAGAEDAAVRATVEHYFRGHATGDGAHFRKVFHPDSKLFFIRDGKFASWTSEEYIGRASGSPAADEAQRKRSIEWIDVTGDSAVAKVRLDYPAVKFVDYLSLLKIDGEWKIVNKTFHANRVAK